MWIFSSGGGILELRRGIQASSCVGPGKPNIPFELRGKAGGCTRVTAGPKRPHLGLCPGPNVPLKGRQGSRGGVPDSPGESGLASRASKGPRSPLKSRCRSLGAHWLASRESSLLFSLERGLGIALRPCRKRRPSPREDGGVSGFSSSCSAHRGVLTRHDEDLREPFVRRHGSQVSMRVARGSASWLSSHWRGLGPQDTLKRDSRGLSRVVAGNPRFPRLLPGTLGHFPGCL